VVALNVVVTDGQRKFVAGLAAGDFAVFEDGVRQDVSFFASSAVPLDLAILLDTSASMSDKIATVQQAAIGFTSTLRANDRITVVDIKDGARIVAPLGEDVDAARQAILATSAKGGTALYNGLYLTIKDMIRQRRGTGEVRRQAIVLLSDGEDTTSLMAFEDVMQVAKESGIAIYTIQLKPKYDTPTAVANKQKYFSQSDYAMKAFAQETGARWFLPATIGDLAGVYAVIAEELANQYSLGYTSKNPKRDGAYRRVVVRISDRPGTLTRTRSGYFAARLQAAR
jgi:Ca-activated chloride channel family protein